MPANPLQPLHEQAEATFLPYGENVQIVESYGEVEAEYAAIRKAVALFDCPHRSVVVLTGKDRTGFLQNKLTNDIAKPGVGSGCYAYMLNLKGRIISDLIVLNGEDATLIDLDTRLVKGFVDQMNKYIFTEDVKVLDAADSLGRLLLTGPRAAELLAKITNAPLDNLTENFRHTKRQIGTTTATIFRQDLCGEPGYELIVPRDRLTPLWQQIHEVGNGHENGESLMGLRAIGWSAFNTARIEAGTPLYGIDITDHYLPLETSHWYTRAVSSTKGCYLGQEIVARMHVHNTAARLLVGLRVTGDKLPVAGTDIFDAANPASQVGMVTSSCLSPMLGLSPVVLGYVKKPFAQPGREVELLAEGARTKAKVVELPFWHKS